MDYSTSRSIKVKRAPQRIAVLTACLFAFSLLIGIVPVSASTLLYDSGDPPQGPGPSLFSDQWVAQPFTAAAAWQMTEVGVFAAGTEPITLSLAIDDQGLPGSVLATWTLDQTDWDPGGSWGYTNADFAFTQGASYWFEYTSSADLFSGDFLPSPAPNGDPNIAISFDQGQSWSIADGAGPLGLRIENIPSSAVPEPTLTLVLIVVLLALILCRGLPPRKGAGQALISEMRPPRPS